jgi:hypothetical protein
MKTIVRDIFGKVLIKNYYNIYCIFTTSENVKVLATHLVACEKLVLVVSSDNL